MFVPEIFISELFMSELLYKYSQLNTSVFVCAYICLNMRSFVIYMSLNEHVLLNVNKVLQTLSDCDEQLTGVFVHRTVACTFHDCLFNYHVKS